MVVGQPLASRTFLDLDNLAFDRGVLHSRITLTAKACTHIT